MKHLRYFKVGDYIRVKMHHFSPFKPESCLICEIIKLPEKGISDVYISKIVYNNSSDIWRVGGFYPFSKYTDEQIELIKKENIAVEVL